MLCQFETARGRKKKGMLEKVYVCPDEAGMFIACATKQIGKTCKKKN